MHVMVLKLSIPLPVPCLKKQRKMFVLIRSIYNLKTGKRIRIANLQGSTEHRGLGETPAKPRPELRK